MKKLILILLALFALSNTANSQNLVSVNDLTYFLDCTSKQAVAQCTKKGYKSGLFSFGTYLYKNTQIQMYSNPNGNTPLFLNPERNASLLLLYTPQADNRIKLAILLSRSKSIADSWVQELKTMGYKSSSIVNNKQGKCWTYYSSKTNTEFELQYVNQSNEYMLKCKYK